MAFRTFKDREGRTWEVRPRSKSEWEFTPAGDNTEPTRSVAPPGYERDPFEMSREELQRLLDAAQAAPARHKPSPFKD
jgi:hypothetical protein